MTIYYVNSVSGKDTNNGTSEATSWATLKRANLAPLQSGDSMVLASGQNHLGNLRPRTKGLSNLTFSSYGTGGRACVVGNSAFPDAILMDATINPTIQELTAIAPNVDSGRAFNIQRCISATVENCSADGGASTLNTRAFNNYMSKGTTFIDCHAERALYGYCHDLFKAVAEGGVWPMSIIDSSASQIRYGKASDHDCVKIVTDLSKKDSNGVVISPNCTGSSFTNLDLSDFGEDAIDIIYARGVYITECYLHDSGKATGENQQFIKSRGPDCHFALNLCVGLQLDKGNGIVALGYNTSLEGNIIKDIGSYTGDAMNHGGGYGILLRPANHILCKNNTVFNARLGIGDGEEGVGELNLIEGNISSGRQKHYDLTPGSYNANRPNITFA